MTHGATISSITLSRFDTSTVPLGRSPFSFSFSFFIQFVEISGNFVEFISIVNHSVKKKCWTTNHMWKSFLAISVIDDVLFVRWLCLHLSSLLLPLYEPSRNRFWLLASISRSVLRVISTFIVTLHYIIITTNDDRAHFLALTLFFALYFFEVWVWVCSNVYICVHFFCMVLPLRRANGKFLVALIRAIQKCKIALRIKHAW